MRMIDKKLIQSGKYYDLETFVINKTLIDKQYSRYIKIMTGCSRKDYAMKNVIVRYACFNIQKNKNIMNQIDINKKNFEIYNNLKRENLDKKIYYSLKVPKWCILIALNSINPETEELFIKGLLEKFIETMNDFIPVEVSDEKINKKNNR